MPDVIKKNPWTTMFGAVAGTALAFVLFAPEFFQQWPIVIAFAKFAAAGGVIGLGINAVDTRRK